MKYENFGKTAIFFLFLFITSAASAVSIITTESRYESNGIRYSFTVSEWGENENICNDASATNCIVQIVGVPYPGQNSYWVSSRYIANKIKPSRNPSEITQQLKNAGFSIPLHGSIFVRNTEDTSNFCISIVYGYQYPGIGGAYNFYGPCAPVVKPPLQCEITGNTLIDHNKLSDAAIDGNEAQASLQLKCTGVTRVTVSASKESPTGIKLRPDGSLLSKITIEGKPAAPGVQISVEEGLFTPVNIKSTLFSNGVVEPGPFSGSTVLTVTPP
ncbi:hypothetical protein IIE18_13820 [Pseudomonas sp. V1]|uniref:MrpH family fimbial adhesin n=1 Tax=Pseudomonas arcuscaelestis TaxID=2710591 RepID=UPI001940162C|nr:hypothetical protein [Pseudomonas arcuscaelestis]MBM3106214.1 hypothetical protein [Pseudomonas arcuscaelestis]